MKTVITISEDSHGQIGVAKDYKCAIDFLVNEGWLNDYVEVFVGENEEGMGEYQRLIEVFGEGWVDIMRDHWNINDFNEYWMNSFYLDEVEVYGS